LQVIFLGVVGDGRSTYLWIDNWVGGVPLKDKFRWLFYLAVYRESTVEEIATLGWEVGGGAWVWRGRLFAWKEETVMKCSAFLSNIVLQDHTHNKWKWMLDHVHGNYVCGDYQFLMFADEPTNRNHIPNVWHPRPCMSVFV